MKRMLIVSLLLALCACSLPPRAPVDAAPVLQGGAQLVSAQGAAVTGRDWNAQPSEARGGDESITK